MGAEVVQIVADLPRDVVADHACRNVDRIGDALRVRSAVAFHHETIEAKEDRAIVVVRVEMNLEQVQRRLRQRESRLRA